MSLSRRLSWVLVLLLASPTFGAAQYIEGRGTETRLVLPPAMRAALHTFDSAFGPRHLTDYAPWHYQPCSQPPECPRPWYKITNRQALFTAIGDFNGDGMLDVALDGDNGRVGARIVILSAGSRYHVQKLHPLEVVSPAIRRFRSMPRDVAERGIGLDQGLAVRGPGTVASDFEAAPLVLTTDAFIVHYFEKAATLYYYRHGQWLQYTVAD